MCICLSVCVSHPLAQTDDGPETEAQCTAATETATQQPTHIHWQRLLETAVNTVYTGLELLWRHLGTQRTDRGNTQIRSYS